MIEHFSVVLSLDRWQLQFSAMIRDSSIKIPPPCMYYFIIYMRGETQMKRSWCSTVSWGWRLQLCMAANTNANNRNKKCTYLLFPVESLDLETTAFWFTSHCLCLPSFRKSSNVIKFVLSRRIIFSLNITHPTLMELLYHQAYIQRIRGSLHAMSALIFLTSLRGASWRWRDDASFSCAYALSLFFAPTIDFLIHA